MLPQQVLYTCFPCTCVYLDMRRRSSYMLSQQVLGTCYLCTNAPLYTRHWLWCILPLQALCMAILARMLIET